MYLNSGFWEVYLCCQLIANMDIWVVSHLENLLQFLELLSCECCPDSPFSFPFNCENKERCIAFYRKRPLGRKKIQRSINSCKLLCSWDGPPTPSRELFTVGDSLLTQQWMWMNSFTIQGLSQKCPFKVLIPLMHCMSRHTKPDVF